VAVLGVVALVAVLVASIDAASGGGPPRIGGLRTQTRSAGGDSKPAKTVTFTVEASGDLLIHSPVWEQALADGGGSHYNFAAELAQINPIIRSVDLPLCHVETPMTSAPPQGFPVFNTPPALAQGIRETGFKVCSTAATHTLDQGQAGIDGTNAALDRNGVLHAGAYSSAAAQRAPLILTVTGVRVAFLSYTDITNGIQSPHPWSVDRANAPQILDEAHRARAAGAKVVIVNIHWGDENVTQPSGRQLALAGQLTASPEVTAVVGQHVHVVQPIRTINGKLVVFGEGNLISNQTSACCPSDEASKSTLGTPPSCAPHTRARSPRSAVARTCSPCRRGSRSSAEREPHAEASAARRFGAGHLSAR
jgi:poly-gamma-glutamate synthesis protein (capsule biosynthesis protein)